MVIDLPGEVKEDGFHEATGGDLLLLGETFAFEDSEEVVEEHVFVGLVLGNDMCSKSEIVI